jgi:hypothetical protein
LSEPTKLDPELTDNEAARLPESRTTDAAVVPGDEVGYRLAEPEAAPIPAPPLSPPSELPPSAPHAAVSPTESTFQPATEEGKSEGVVAEFPDEPPVVDEVWSRWAEWKEPLLWSGGGIALATLIVFGGPWVAIALFVVASAYGAYYVVISLAVPVRVTPEQAAREFYEAAGHRLPNFRRMFVLLTSDGRVSDDFTDYASFRSYWQMQIARLSRSPAWLVPLEFRVEGCRCRYNGEKTLAAVDYTLRVSPRGAPASSEPAAEFQMRILAVKGPDCQWYLNDGTLPETD